MKSLGGRQDIWYAEGPFTLPQVARLSGLHSQTLRYWILQGFIKPKAQVEPGSGNWIRLSFPELVAVRAAAELRRKGVSLEAMRRISKHLTSFHGLEQPFSQARLIVNGDTVILLEGQDEARKAWDVLKAPGQGVMSEVLVLDVAPLVENLRQEIRQRVELQSRKEGRAATA